MMTATTEASVPLHDIQPALWIVTDAAFTDPAWTFELSLSGYRMLAASRDSVCTLHSRRHVDITARFAEIGGALRDMNLADTVFDGELCAFDALGRVDPAALHRRGTASPYGTPAESSDKLVYSIFDVLVHQGRDLRAMPWMQRRLLLMGMAPLASPLLRLQRSVPARGEWMLEQARAIGRRGVVARRSDAAYVGGLSSGWRFIACHGEHADVEVRHG